MTRPPNKSPCRRCLWSPHFDCIVDNGLSALCYYPPWDCFGFGFALRMGLPKAANAIRNCDPHGPLMMCPARQRMTTLRTGAVLALGEWRTE